MKKMDFHFYFLKKIFPLFFLFTLFTVSSITPAATSSTSPQEILEKLGFTLLENSPSPISFALPSASSLSSSSSHKKYSLEDFRGKWVWLVFWATWCGPCVQEMPALEELYQEYKNKGFSVLAVSVDQDPSSVYRYLQGKKFSFPILLDSQNNVASQYQASALPTLYAISPDHKLAAILQGARDWSSKEVKEKLETLLSFKKYQYKPSPGGSSYNPKIAQKLEEDQNNKILSLPNNLIPPELSIETQTQNQKIGQTFSFSVHVLWKGKPEEYQIKIPKLTLSEGIIQQEPVSSSSNSEGQGMILSYVFTLRIEKEGEHKIGPIEIAYSPRAGGKELFSRHEGTSFTVEKNSLHPMLIPGISGIAICLCTFFFFFTQKKKQTILDSSASSSLSQFDPSICIASFEKIRKMKLQGDQKSYMIALLKLYLQVEEKTELQKNQHLVSLLDKVQFGGQLLSEGELTNLEKKIEKRINHLNPNKEFL